MGIIVTEGVLARGGKLTVGRRKLVLPPMVVETAEFKALKAGPVRVAVSTVGTKPVVAIAKEPGPNWKPRWILCYLPAPEMLREIEPLVRDALLDAMVAGKVITREFAEEARVARTSARAGG